jgi:hypothetical protein
MQLHNVKPTNPHISNSCFNSVLGVFYALRTSRVRQQEDHLYMQFLRYVFHVFM